MFVVCPYTDATQSGVVMSAFAYNKPVLVTDVGGLPEMAGNGRFGRIVKNNDVGALADAIVQMTGSPEELECCACNIASAYGSGRLSWQSIAKELNSEYKKICNRK